MSIQSSPSVLVTRPEPEASALSQCLKDMGWSPRSLPLVTFTANTENPPLPVAPSKPTVVIAISPRAIDYGIPWLKKVYPFLLDDQKTSWFTLGPKSSVHLNQLGISPANHHHQQALNSEQLLQDPRLSQPSENTQCLILKGIGGRELLKDTLQARGFVVSEANVYKRKMPIYTDAELSAVFKDRLDCFTVTSGEIMGSLVNILTERLPSVANVNALYGCSQSWKAVPILVVGKRQLTVAQQYGFRTVITAPSADTRTLMQTLKNYFR